MVAQHIIYRTFIDLGTVAQPLYAPLISYNRQIFCVFLIYFSSTLLVAPDLYVWLGFLSMDGVILSSTIQWMGLF